MNPRKTIYLAGPEVFLPDAIAIGSLKKQLCEAYGFVGLFPLDNDPAAGATGEPVDRGIYRANVAMMQRADCVIANLTPFRGPSADVGTAFELGLVTGLGKPCFAYTNAADDLCQRMARGGLARFDTATGLWRDRDGTWIEDFGNADNLMLTACLAQHGHPLIQLDIQETRRLHDLQGFEACLRLAQAGLGASA